MSMANRISREQWRVQVERYLASDMSVAEWCQANKLPESSMFKWIGHFAECEPELFGGPQNIVSRDRGCWITKTRENMRASVALARPATASGGFVRVDALSLADRDASVEPHASRAVIRVELNGAVVNVPAGFPAGDAAAVLRAVASL